MGKEVKGRNGGKLIAREKGDPPLPGAGRPKKLISSMLAELKELGYEPLTKTQILDVYTQLAALDRPKLTEIVADDGRPMFLRNTAKRLLAKDAFEITERMLDRAIGRPTTAIGFDGGSEWVAPVLNIQVLSTGAKILTQESDIVED